jgi:hypothetical protein
MEIVLGIPNESSPSNYTPQPLHQMESFLAGSPSQLQHLSYQSQQDQD